MAAEYDIRQDFLGTAFTRDGRVDYLSYSPSCLVAIIPFFNPVTYSRSEGKSGSRSAYEAVRTKPILVIDTDLLSVGVQQSKNSPVGSMNATLSASDREYLNDIFPSDWIFVWMVYDDNKREALKARLLQGKACNEFNDGLKFVGRVSSIRKAFIQQPAGTKIINYTLQGNSFKEMDSQIFYDPYFQEAVPGVFDFMGRISKGINQLFDPSSTTGGSITTYSAFTTFLDLIIGTGIPKNSFSAGISQAIPQTQVATLSEEGQVPYAYCVPAAVGTILAKPARTKPGDTPCYADILELVIGVQSYSKQLSSPMTGQVAGKAFSPDNIPEEQNCQRRYTNSPLLGVFNPEQPKFDNRPLWSILTQYLNSAVNEMYTCLRVNPAGNVVPTLVVRQFPFSTDLLDSTLEDLAPLVPDDDIELTPLVPQTAPFAGQKTKTTFLSLPRWVLDPILVTGADVGRSDAMHFNFVHIYGDSDQEFAGGGSLVDARLENPPKIDDLDVKRTGIRLYPVQTVNCSGEDVQNGASRRWMELVADFAMGQHLTLNGTINTIGIQAPIAPGDNCSLNETVFHIEEVCHQWSIQGGMRRFVTTLCVTHGLRDDPAKAVQGNPHEQFPDKFLYQGVLPGDLTSNDPGITKVEFPLASGEEGT